MCYVNRNVRWDQNCNESLKVGGDEAQYVIICKHLSPSVGERQRQEKSNSRSEVKILNTSIFPLEQRCLD